MTKIKDLLASGVNISITVTPSDLKEFAYVLIDEAKEIGRAEKTTEKYLTQKEVVEKLRVSACTLWRWKQTGYLVPSKVGNAVYYKSSDIEKLLEEK